MNKEHRPVMLREAVDMLNITGGPGVWVDATLGRGGHSREILRRLPKEATLLGIDRDKEAVEITGGALKNFTNFKAVAADFRDIETVLAENGAAEIRGVLFDFGVSSPQLDDPSRGFSFMNDAPLDMRMDRSRPLTAADVVNTYPREKLEEIIRGYGEERFYRRIAGEIIKSRPLATTAELAAAAVRSARGRQKIHPATRLFQAIRIEVNDELAAISAGLKAAVKMLAPGGRAAAISFHSLEDRIVKRFFAAESRDCICEDKRMPCSCGHSRSMYVITRKPVTPSIEEIQANPRSRSARLRAAEKII